MGPDTSVADRRIAVGVAWTAVLASLIDIALRELLPDAPTDELRIAVPVGIAIIGLTLSFWWMPVRPLRAFFGLLLTLVVTQWVVYTFVVRAPFFQQRLTDASTSVRVVTEQILRLMVTAVIIAVLLVVKRRPSAFFLVPGRLAAPVAPIRWLGTKPTLRWNRFGPNLAFFISLGTLAFLLISAWPPTRIMGQLIPLVPVILVTAALNAFSEEVTMKASFLSVLEEPLGRRQSLLLMAALFGLAHYYGMPNGVVGVIMAGFLGWILGRSMLETRGMFWAWFIHFWQDILIFAFVLGGAITIGAP